MCLRVKDFEGASCRIQKACSIISGNESDQVKILFLAFKMQCQLKDQDEALTIFQQLFNSKHVTSEPIFECFNVMVQNDLHMLAINLGAHLLRACQDCDVDPHMQKNFLLKFLFVFDRILQQQKGKESDQSIEQVVKALIETIGKVITVQFL